MTHELNRRQFITAVAALSVGGRVALDAQAPPIPIIDTHIHIFDLDRPEGAPPYPRPGAPQGRQALMPRFREVAKPHNVVGTIIVEAQLNSAAPIHTQWELNQAESDTLAVGTIGRIDPVSPEFGTQLERFHRNRLFLGIRQNTFEGLETPPFIANLKLLSQAGLTMDYSTPLAVAPILKIADQVPDLRIVFAHLPNARMPADKPARDAYVTSLKELGKRPQVFIKFSEIVKQVNGVVPADVAAYKEWVDQLWDIFGEDRIVFGSDWPQSETVELNSYPKIMAVTQAYMAGKSRGAQEKVFWRNSIRAYRWGKRAADQPQA